VSEFRGATRPRAILFDWDNTLVDNWAAIADALNTVFAAFDKPTWTVEETKARVRQSLRDSFPTMFGARWEEARDMFYARFGARHIELLSPVPGAGELIAELAGTGTYLGIVSNKNGVLLRREAEHLGWSRYFGRIVGAADAPRDKPAAEPVAMALEPGGVAPGREVWFVGDSGIDMQCARAAGCVPVLIAAAVTNRDEFQAFPPEITVANLNRLGALLRPL
jgi:phosphoglycolate phosphatase